MNAPIHSELVNFDKIENESSHERRGELFCQVANLLRLASENCSDEQLDIYDSVLVRLADMVEAEARAIVADRLADLRRAPESLMRRLSTDEIRVARPVLVRSTVLTNNDLIRIAESLGQGHLSAIAERELLSEELTDVIVSRGDVSTRRVVAGNPGANFSERGFDTLVQASRFDESLQEIVGDREDLPDEVIESLVAFASEQVRRKLVNQGKLADADRVESATRLAADRMSNEYWLSRYDFETAWMRALPLARQDRLDETILRGLAASDRFADTVAVFALLSDTSLEDAKHWLVRPDTDPFIIVARAMDFSIETVNEILRSGPWRYRLKEKDRQASLRRFESLSKLIARDMLERWRASMAVG